MQNQLCSIGNEFTTVDLPKVINRNGTYFATNYKCRCGKAFSKVVIRNKDGMVYIPFHNVPLTKTHTKPEKMLMAEMHYRRGIE